MEHRRRELALDLAAGRNSERAFLAAMRRPNEEKAVVGGEVRRIVDGPKAIDCIRNLAVSWAKAKPPTRATMIQSPYEEIVVRGEESLRVRLSPEAHAHGLALALPQVVMARPTGLGHAITTYTIPIEGRDEWLAAARRLA